eukprot:2468155-Lingulodinium_polyedra.AAC.1
MTASITTITLDFSSSPYSGCWHVSAGSVMGPQEVYSGLVFGRCGICPREFASRKHGNGKGMCPERNVRVRMQTYTCKHTEGHATACTCPCCDGSRRTHARARHSKLVPKSRAQAHTCATQSKSARRSWPLPYAETDIAACGKTMNFNARVHAFTHKESKQACT